jgi:hypothetical protein
VPAGTRSAGQGRTSSDVTVTPTPKSTTFERMSESTDRV